jgi:PAS domain S-box-containing protein
MNDKKSTKAELIVEIKKLNLKIQQLENGDQSGDQSALQDNGSEYSDLFKHILNGYAVHEIVCDSSGKPVDYRYLDINPAFEKLTGLTRDIIGKTVHEVIPDIEDYWIETYGKVALTGESRRLENYNETLGKWFEITVFSPAKYYFACVFSDITEHRKAEEEAHKYKDYLMSVLNCVADPICVKDKQHKWVLVNDAFCDISGQSRETLIGKSDYDFFPKKEADVFWEKDNQVFETGMDNISEETITDSKGQTRSIITKKTLYRNPSGEEFCVAIGRDVTSQKQVQQALRENEEFMREVINTTPACIFVKDYDGRFLLVNRMMADFHNTTIEKMVGKKEYEVSGDSAVQIKEVDKYLADDRSVIDSGKPMFITEEPYTMPKGDTVWLQTTKIPLTLKGNPRCVLGIAFDITSRKEAEEALRKSEENLFQSQKMEAVGRLAGGIAHDFNNLLTAIIGYSEILMIKDTLNDDEEGNLQEIIKAAKRASELTQQLLAFSRKQILHPKIIDLNKLVTDTEGMLRRLIGENIDIVTRLESGLRYVKADPGQVNQVLMNLVVNARDAMPDGGKLTLRTQNVYLDESYFKDNIKGEPGEYILLTVSDTGKGMSPEMKDHIFEPFFTTKEKGTGLGLATVYGIIKQSGGYIWVNSDADKGTVFKVYFPSIKKGESKLLKEKLTVEPERGTETILVVEDEEIVRRMTSDSLRLFGYEVIEADGGKEALKYFKKHKECDIDLLISDVVMPDISGRELVRRVLADNPDLNILYISGYTDETTLHHGVKDDVLPLLKKPFSPNALARKVREILDSGKK